MANCVTDMRARMRIVMSCYVIWEPQRLVWLQEKFCSRLSSAAHKQIKIAFGDLALFCLFAHETTHSAISLSNIINGRSIAAMRCVARTIISAFTTWFSAMKKRCAMLLLFHLSSPTTPRLGPMAIVKQWKWKNERKKLHNSVASLAWKIRTVLWTFVIQYLLLRRRSLLLAVCRNDLGRERSIAVQFMRVH